MNIIFVGIHNKPNTDPLCWNTKSGKLLQRVIDNFHTIHFDRTNLYNLDHMPIRDQKRQLAIDWHFRIKPGKEDIIILLGDEVRKNFIERNHIILNFAHPASKRSHKVMNRYVKRMINTIMEQI